MSDETKESTWLDRVINEADELVDKLTKLQLFLQSEGCNQLAPDDRSLLLSQQTYMAAYLGVLQRRIARAETDPS